MKYGYEEYEDPALPCDRTLRQGWVKQAHKRHSCDACRAPIEVGKPYYQTVAIHEGTFVVFRSHDPLHACAYRNPK